jgi:DNA-binding transcriptional ArsR family regulator
MNDEAFQTLADPTRRRIVEVLLDGERSVGEIVARVEIQQSGVSRHLAILNAAGFVQVRADGQKRLYSLRPEPFRELDGWVARFRALWEARLDRFEAALKHKVKERP